MRTPDEIRSIQFTKNTMGGYKPSEVDNFIDEIAMQIETMALKMKDLDMRNRELENKVSLGDTSGASIQNILIAAQKVADEVEKQAKENADKIISDATAKAADAKCEQVLVATHEKIESDKQEAERQTTALITETAKKVEAMTKAAKDSVEREQLLFDKLKVEIVAFRKTLTAQFLEQAEMIKKLPDSVPFDPERAAKAAGFQFDKEPDFASFAVTKETAAEDVVEQETPSADDVLKTYTVNYDETKEVDESDLDDQDENSQLKFDQDNN